MKKHIIIPIVLVLLGWGIFVFIDQKTVRSKNNIINLSWANIRKDKLSHITTSSYNNDKNSYTIQKENGEWILTFPINITIFPEKALLLANSFLTLTPLQQLTNITSNDLTNYGLMSPKLHIQGTFDSQDYGFFIGDKTTVGEQYYIMDDKVSNTVYIVNAETIAPFMNGVSSIINNKFLTKSIDDVIAIDFKNMQNTNITLTNQESFWVQKVPTENPHVDWGTRKFLLSMKDIYFYSNSLNFNISEESLLDLGIDVERSPKISLLFKDGSTNDLFIGSNIKNNSYPIYISREKITAYSDKILIDSVFSTTVSDLNNKTK